jgi:hypothetical protein
MADRKSPAQRLPDTLREAVERTVQSTRDSVEATRESAKDTRGRAQDAVDDLLKGAEAGAETLRDRVRGARPVTSDDLKDLRRELRAIGRRLDAIEERLPKGRSGGGASRAGTKSGGGSGAKRSAAKRSASAGRSGSAKRGGSAGGGGSAKRGGSASRSSRS